jgi:hypothetical protein
LNNDLEVSSIQCLVQFRKHWLSLHCNIRRTLCRKGSEHYAFFFCLTKDIMPFEQLKSIKLHLSNQFRVWWLKYQILHSNPSKKSIKFLYLGLPRYTLVRDIEGHILKMHSFDHQFRDIEGHIFQLGASRDVYSISNL